MSEGDVERSLRRAGILGTADIISGALCRSCRRHFTEEQIEREFLEDVCLKCARNELFALRESVKRITEHLKHLGLEPWPDGRSIRDGKRPWDQHVAMVISSLVASNSSNSSKCSPK